MKESASFLSSDYDHRPSSSARICYYGPEQNSFCKTYGSGHDLKCLLSRFINGVD